MHIKLTLGFMMRADRATGDDLLNSRPGGPKCLHRLSRKGNGASLDNAIYQVIHPVLRESHFSFQYHHRFP